jgi:hypothetical protein
MTNQVAVIIPVYKQNLNVNELISLRQCIKILKKYPIIFIGPNQLDKGIYEKTCNGVVPFKWVSFENKYFSGIAGYNKLMLSAAFYKTFFNYKYLLIYQLDAYVFKDELSYWCDMGYDFLGAPNAPHSNDANEMQFLTSYQKLVNIVNTILRTKHKISNVGNGGFSLRNTRKCYWLLTVLSVKVMTWGSNNEDGFFKYWGNIFYPFFKLPADKIALRFSVEHAPAASLKQLENVLPFGCHAFEKYEPEFWKLYIK